MPLLSLLIAIPCLVAPAQVTDQAPDPKQHAGDQKPSVLAHSDEEILALLMALNDGEIGAAGVAMKKNVDQKVVALATLIEQDHRKDKDESNRLAAKIGIRPKATAASKDLVTKGEDKVRSLRTKEGRAFEDLFVSEMGQGHRDALLMLDGFLETAQNEELKTHLNETRQHVALHLQEVERIRGKAPDTAK
jgi:putative membrane protein